MDILLRDNSNNEVYWVRNYRIEVTEGSDSTGDYTDIVISGQFYNPDHGYITISTQTPIRVYDTDGGITKARLTFVSSTTYQVVADTDGDGDFDDYDSGVLLWANL
jgi:hypothetical protein